MVAESLAYEFPHPFRRLAVRRVVYGLVAILAVALYGTAGYVVMGWNFLDSLFQVVITISGVGFNEVRPLVSTSARIHTMMVIGLGMLSVAFTLGSFVQFLTESEVLDYLGRHRMMKQIETLSGHTIVVGYGRVGGLVCDELAARNQSFVVVEVNPERVATAEARGFACMQGDATEEHVLKAAGIVRARVLVSVMPNDAENVFITLSARQLCSTIIIVARAEGPGTPRKLKLAGADHVVMPAAIGANRIVSLLTNPGAVEFAELVTNRSSVAIEMDEMPINGASPLAGRSLREADVKRRTGVIVVAIKRADGRVDFPPSSEGIMAPGDTVVILGRRPNLDQFRQQYFGA